MKIRENNINGTYIASGYERNIYKLLIGPPLRITECRCEKNP
jgi:hypothetical protein